MLYVTVIGALFLTWFVLVLLFTPALELPGTSAGAGQLAGFPPPARVHLPGRDARRQPCGGVHRWAAASTRRCSRPSATADRSVNLECYIFNAGEVGDEFVRALAERAKAGVVVTIVADAIGSSGMSSGRDQRAHGGGLPAGVVPAGDMVSARAAEQPDPSGDSGHRRVHRVRGRCRDCRLVDEGERDGEPAVARHDGAARGPGCLPRCRACSSRTGWSAAARS